MPNSEIERAIAFLENKDQIGRSAFDIAEWANHNRHILITALQVQCEYERVIGLAGKLNVVDLVRENLRLANSIQHLEAKLITLQAQIKPDCEDNPIVKNVLEWCDFAIKNERSKRCKDFARHLIDVINAMADDSPSCGRELKGGE